MINSKALRTLMIDQSVTYDQLADLLGLSPVTIRQKIYNVRPMKLSEAEKIQSALHIPDVAFAQIFFMSKSHSATND